MAEEKEKKKVNDLLVREALLSGRGAPLLLYIHYLYLCSMP